MPAAASRHRRNVLDDTDSESEPDGNNTAISRASSRSTLSVSQRYATMLEEMRSHLVQDLARESQMVTANVSAAAATLQSPPTP